MQPAEMRNAGIALLLATPTFATALTLPSLWPRQFTTEHGLSRRNTTTIPAAIDIAPSQYWDGDDGPWSSFTLQVGKQVQTIRTFISTAGGNVIAVNEAGCPSYYPADCASQRGGLFDINGSATYIPNSIYNIGIGDALGRDVDAVTGFDTVTLGWQGSNGPTAEHTVVFSTPTSDMWLGLFGVNPRPTNFTTYGDPTASFMEQLVKNGTIPSTSYGYTAGNQYRLNKVFGSLILGGYDANRFAPTNVTFPFDADVSLDLSVNLKSITTNGGATNLLPGGQIRVFLDSSFAQLWLPESACAAFEQAFGLTWDELSNFYLVNRSLHTTLQQQNPSVTFTIGPDFSGGKTVDITLPYGAFDLEVTFPNVINPNSSYYFPLKRAANSTQYIFGRTFFQEAYLITDYDRGNFTVAPCTWNQNQLSNANIVTILTANETSREQNNNNSSGISTGAIVGIVVGVVLGLIIILAGALVWIRRKKQEKKRIAELDAKKNNAENKDSSDTSKPFISHPMGGELGADSEIHELNAPPKPFAQEMESPHKLDPNKAGYSEMEAGGYFGPGKSPLGSTRAHAAEMSGSTPIYEMPDNEIMQELPGSEIRPAERKPNSPPEGHI